MTAFEELKQDLDSAASLFRANGEQGWADVMDEASRRVARDAVAGAADVKSLFNGAGSLSDIVLYRNGAPLIEENDTLEALRVRIYAHARALA